MLLIIRCYIDINIYKIINGGRNMIQEKLGKRIREIRKEKGYSQEKFALLINMDRTYLASVEAGKRNISIRNIKKITDGLEISLEELFKDI